MTEQEMMKKIKDSAYDLEIPEGIEPEKMKGKFHEGQKLRRKHKIKYLKIGGTTAVAACLMFVYVSGVFLSSGRNQGAFDTSSGMEADGSFRIEDIAVNPNDEVLEEAAKEKKRDAGDLYVLAKDYGEVYEVLSQDRNMRGAEGTFISSNEDAGEGLGDNAGETVEVAGTSGIDDAAVKVEEKLYFDESAKDTAANPVYNSNAIAEDISEEKEFSKTNLQTAGVDESDIIKTDGSYIYTVTNNEIFITDVKTDTMMSAGKISVSMNSGSDRIREMFIDGDTLNLILEKENTQLNQNDKTVLEDNTENSAETSDSDDMAIYDMDTYYLDSKTVTELLTYDISDRKNPLLKGSVTQEGNYRTSRKIGSIIYLFTYEGVSAPHLQKEEAILEDNTGGWIPLVNGEEIAADCIYIPKEQGREGLIISSVDINKPDKVIDNTMILNNYVEIYVGNSSIYLYDLKYEASVPNTQIAKFSMSEGQINAVGAASVRGEIYDTFAINENQGKLRVLTTDWSGTDNENQLYLLDENMNLTGKLEGIAKGEQIYAARFFGNTAYFVTYRNTDPLFAVDLSDEKNPKILSELKITGFSEYLHFWGNDKLLGIGYETDEKSGEQLGIKLTMFDISNPADVQTVGTCVIENADYSPALYNYKCVLVDEKENMIGFATESYGEKQGYHYLLFSWEDGKFKEQMAESLSMGKTLEYYRGIYIGDIFYLVHPSEIISYDRKNEYQWMQKLLLSDSEN